ncbi:MAG: 5'/3'-nucleotidase SurE [Polyangiaceae bacterium]|jgi:5'-nucleotidase
MEEAPPPLAPLALLSNDDGVGSQGLAAMREALRQRFDVIVIAPETEQSASSHSLSLHRPLRLRKLEEGLFALDGTPADCVYVALHGGTKVVPRRPDLVVSGINRGLNLGQDVFYSGTVAAAREGALRGIPALAVSAHPNADLAAVGRLATRVSLELLAQRAGDSRGALLNLNVPKRWNGEIRATRIGSRIYEETVDFRTDPRGREYLWLGGPGVRHERNTGTDTDAYDDGAASITPLVLDLTHHEDDGLTAGIVAKLRVHE